MHISSGEFFYCGFLENYVFVDLQIGTNPATIGDYHFDGSRIIHYSDMSNSIISGKAFIFSAFGISLIIDCLLIKPNLPP